MNVLIYGVLQTAHSPVQYRRTFSSTYFFHRARAIHSSTSAFSNGARANNVVYISPSSLDKFSKRPHTKQQQRIRCVFTQPCQTKGAFTPEARMTTAHRTENRPRCQREVCTARSPSARATAAIGYPPRAHAGTGEGGRGREGAGRGREGPGGRGNGLYRGSLPTLNQGVSLFYFSFYPFFSQFGSQSRPYFFNYPPPPPCYLDPPHTPRPWRSRE